MQFVYGHLQEWDRALPRIPLCIDRRTLAKRRWRGVAADGVEFGFQLDHPLSAGDIVAASPAAAYFISQNPEPVLEVALGPDPSAAARLGWIIGNLHFPLQIAGAALRVPDDSALRQLFDREKIAFTPCDHVFTPLSGGHSHEPHHP
jgi:urease accessory protein